MKRHIAILLIFICAFLFSIGSAFAKSAPNAMSFFTNSSYNKTYTDNDGFEHTMTVTWVGETWNKVGAVIYSINYEDVYERDGAIYTGVKSTTKIFENARPTYPDSPEHSVYRVNWYRNGSKKVIFDHRSAAPEPTPAPTPKPTASPKPTPTVTPEMLVVPKPASTPKPVLEPVNTPVNPPVSDNLISSNTAPITTETQETMVNESIVPAASLPEPEGEVEKSQLSGKWFLIAFVGIGAAVWLAIYLMKKRKEEKRR